MRYSCCGPYQPSFWGLVAGLLLDSTNDRSLAFAAPLVVFSRLSLSIAMNLLHKRRTGYAISYTFITKTASGGAAFNWSEVGGNALEAALSNAYYPPEERGLSQTAVNWGTQMESAVLNQVFQEFWPETRRKVLRQKIACGDGGDGSR